MCKYEQLRFTKIPGKPAPHTQKKVAYSPHKRTLTETELK